MDLENRWISIEDRLPKPFETILMIYKQKEIIAGFMDEPGDCGCGEICLYGVNTHKSLGFYEFILVSCSKERPELNPLEPMSILFWMPLGNSIDDFIIYRCPGLSVYFKEKI